MPKSSISTKKLKAIVFTDIVDFTQLSADDEQKALEIIDKQRDLLKPIVLEYKGEWLKEIGDGLLFCFDSSLDAVRCSIKIQEALKDVNDFKIRIGIHQGDIFVKDGDVYGDDVNIASRVEGFSPEGGITISDKVYKDIQGVKEIKTAFIGHRKLKGVEQETQIRCITSHSLPKIKSSKFISFTGYLAYFLGIIRIINGFYSLITEPLTPKVFDTIMIVYAGFIILILGYNCFAYKRGLSKKSQRYLIIATVILIFIDLLIPFIAGLIVGALA
tara:strand:+ start:44 stop:862 length:819 start_codon:yes stop_codon:yes gene_type:complete